MFSTFWLALNCQADTIECTHVDLGSSTWANVSVDSDRQVATVVEPPSGSDRMSENVGGLEGTTIEVPLSYSVDMGQGVDQASSSTPQSGSFGEGRTLIISYNDDGSCSASAE